MQQTKEVDGVRCLFDGCTRCYARVTPLLLLSLHPQKKQQQQQQQHRTKNLNTEVTAKKNLHNNIFLHATLTVRKLKVLRRMRVIFNVGYLGHVLVVLTRLFVPSS